MNDKKYIIISDEKMTELSKVIVSLQSFFDYWSKGVITNSKYQEDVKPLLDKAEAILDAHDGVANLWGKDEQSNGQQNPTA